MEKSTGAEDYLFPVPIEHTKLFIDDHIHNISSVKRLASMMGYSRSYLSIKVKGLYGMTISELLRRVRFRKIRTLITEYPHETSRSIASRLGLRDEQALYKFLSRHYGTNFTEIRKELLNGE